MYPYPIKNWRNESEYEDHNNLEKWAWEFFRRNPEYQQDIDRCKKGLEGFKDAQLEGVYKLTEDEKGIWAHSKRENGESAEPLYIHIQKKYGMGDLGLGALKMSDDKQLGLINLPDPKDDSVDTVLFNTARSIPISRGFHLDKDKNVIDATPVDFSIHNKFECAVIFDVSQPIELQIKKASEELKRLADLLRFKQPKNRMSATKFKGYVRVLDALADGVNIEDMASVIVPHLSDDYGSGKNGSQTIRNWLNAAKELRDSGYASIAHAAGKEYFK